MNVLNLGQNGMVYNVDETAIYMYYLGPDPLPRCGG